MYVHSSLYISSIMRTLQSDDHIQDTYVLFLRLIDPRAMVQQSAAWTDFDLLLLLLLLFCRFFNFLFCFVLFWVGDGFTTSLTVGESGTLLFEDFHLLEKLAHFSRERVPERVVHAKGAGAHGYFEVTK